MNIDTRSCDTPHRWSLPVQDQHTMGTMTGRIDRRDDGQPYVPFQTNTAPETKKAFMNAAKSQGLKLSVYLDRLAADLIAEHGEMPRVSIPHRQESTLDIDVAA